MPIGLQCFDGSGNLTLSLGDRIARFTGSVVTNGVSGSVPFPGGNTGTPFFVVIPIGTQPLFFKPPGVSINGTTVSWNYGVDSGTSDAVNCVIRFGVY